MESNKSNKSESNKSNKSESNNSNTNMSSTDMITYFIDLIHILVKFIPIGIYFFAYLSSTLYKDIRSALLLIGLIINELIGYLYKKYTKYVPKDECHIFDKGSKNYKLDFLQNSHTEIIAFVSTFFFSDMYHKQKLNIIPFTSLLILVFLTIWSRLSIKCEENKDVIFNLVIGIIWGALFYYFVKEYYLSAERGIIEKNTCDLGYDNYKCSEIKNGTVIMKHGQNNNDENDVNDENNENDVNDEN
jgi:hypothetical protein